MRTNEIVDDIVLSWNQRLHFSVMEERSAGFSLLLWLAS